MKQRPRVWLRRARLEHLNLTGYHQWRGKKIAWGKFRSLRIHNPIYRFIVRFLTAPQLQE